MTFEVGDTVRVIDKSGKFYGRVGRVVTVVPVVVMIYYAVEFDDRIIASFTAREIEREKVNSRWM